MCKNVNENVCMSISENVYVHENVCVSVMQCLH